ncbi:hypothetical protein D3C81_1387880 [compost metagenome]
MIRRFGHTAVAVWLVVDRRAAITIGSHGSVTLIIVHFGDRPVDWECVMVRTYTVTVGIGVGEDAPLKHFVRRSFNARYEVARR